MAGRRILYSVLLITAAVFHIAYGQYITHFVLLFLLFLPVISLLVSLPSIMASSARLQGGEDIFRGRQRVIRLETECGFFFPPCVWKIRVEQQNLFMEEEPELHKVILRGTREKTLVFEPDTTKIGVIRCSIRSARVCDHLGLFAIPIKKSGGVSFTIMPEEKAPIPEPELVEPSLKVLKPKPMGFSEEHELRPYREGDQINLIHWKLTMKMDEPIVREPQEVIRKNIVLAVSLPENYEEKQSVLEQLMYLGNRLSEHDIPYLLYFGKTAITILSAMELERFMKSSVLSKPMHKEKAPPINEGTDTLVYYIVPQREAKL